MKVLCRNIKKPPKKEYEKELRKIGYTAFVKQARPCNMEIISAQEVFEARKHEIKNK